MSYFTKKNKTPVIVTTCSMAEVCPCGRAVGRMYNEMYFKQHCASDFEFVSVTMKV